MLFKKSSLSNKFGIYLRIYNEKLLNFWHVLRTQVSSRLWYESESMRDHVIISANLTGIRVEGSRSIYEFRRHVVERNAGAILI